MLDAVTVEQDQIVQKDVKVDPAGGSSRSRSRFKKDEDGKIDES